MKSLKALGSLDGRWAVITGASGNLGRVISETLAELGCNLILVDHPEKNCHEIIEKILENWDVKVKYFGCNLEIESSRDNLISLINNEGHHLDILINNAAYTGASQIKDWNVDFEQQSIHHWNKVFEVNLFSVFHLCQKLYPLLSKSGTGTIVNIASIHGISGPVWSLYENLNMANPAAYSASKGGLVQLTKWLATTVAPEVRVNAISPGGIQLNQQPEFIARYSEKTPMARMATPEDFKGVIAFLSSDLSKYVTGQNLILDGGWTVW
jgi:short-subunit dehydrogenase